MKRMSALVVLALVAGCSGGAAAPPTSAAATTTVTTAVATTTTVAPDTRIPVLLDYSPTVSDIGALVFVATHPALRLVAVTLPGTGESYCEPGVAHTRGVLELLDLGDVPVACGPDEPITGWNAFPTSWRVGSNEMDLPEAAPNDPRSAPDLIADVVTGSDAPIQILAVAPLTNLALAFESDPSLAGRVGGITIMGGAVDVPGNVIRNEVAEWNIWVDPTAAGIVLASGAPVTLVPLDATNHLPANRFFFDALDGAASTPGSVLVRDLIAVDEFWLAGGYYFWDELAAAVLADESLVELETRTLVVDDTERENKGWTREDAAGSDVRVAVSADRAAFEQLYLDTLVGTPTDLGHVEATADEIAYFDAVTAVTADFQAELDRIFEAAIAGVEEEPDDGSFLTIVASVLPTILDGPWLDMIDSLAALDVPGSLTELHETYVERLIGFLDVGDEAVTALTTGDGDLFDSYLGPVTDACAAIAAAAEMRLMDPGLICF